MKLVVTILTIYLTSLSVFPCADTLTDKDCESEIHLHDAEDNHSDTEDDCSPLCQCQCCGVQMTTTQSGNISVISVDTSDLNFAYYKHFGNEFLNTPFQPPQV